MSKIVFVRHAHRDTMDRGKDNGLDDKGRRQVDDLLSQLAKGEIPKADEFWSSPKRRCIETLEPLAKEFKSRLKIVTGLDEQKMEENSKAFHARVNGFLKKILVEAQSHCVYLCSHGDVLPILIEELTGQCLEVKKGQAVICTLEGNRWILE